MHPQVEVVDAATAGPAELLRRRGAVPEGRLVLHRGGLAHIKGLIEHDVDGVQAVVERVRLAGPASVHHPDAGRVGVEDVGVAIEPLIGADQVQRSVRFREAVRTHPMPLLQRDRAMPPRRQHTRLDHRSSDHSAAGSMRTGQPQQRGRVVRAHFEGFDEPAQGAEAQRLSAQCPIHPILELARQGFIAERVQMVRPQILRDHLTDSALMKSMRLPSPDVCLPAAGIVLIEQQLPQHA